MRLAVVLFVGCVVVWAAAAVLAAVAVWNAVLPDVVVVAAAASLAAVELPSLTYGAVAEHFAVKPRLRSAGALVSVAA